MARSRRPEKELTSEQLRKRAYNEKYRAKLKEKGTKLGEKKARQVVLESKQALALISNGSETSFSNKPSHSKPRKFSNVIAFPIRETGADFFNELVEKLQAENALLRTEIARLQNGARRQSFLRRMLIAFCMFVAVVPIPALLVWQMKEMLELTGNRGGLVLAAGLEYAVLVAAAVAGVAKTAWQRAAAGCFVLCLTAVMALYVVSGIEKRTYSGSDSFRRLSEERQMLLADRSMYESQLAALPPAYKTKRSEIQAKIEAKTTAVATVGARLDSVQKTGSGENPLAVWANIGSRILLMLLEALLVHMVFARRRTEG